MTRFDLEDPAAVARLADPMLALGELVGLVVLDEIQQRPDLFSSLRVLADRRPLWLRGGFPRAFLARTERDSFEWRQQFMRTFLERDLPLLGISAGSQAMHRFWSMLAHCHRQLWNSSEIGRSMALADTSATSGVRTKARNLICW